jgi:hypothetical protein
MKKLLTMPWELAKALFGLTFPMFRGGGMAVASSGSFAAWIARGALIAVFLLGLGLLNQSETLGIRKWIPHGRINRFWLPLFAFCSYAMLWLGWLLYGPAPRPCAPGRWPDVTFPLPVGQISTRFHHAG